jgi:protein-disulfide isomerase
MKQRIWQVFGLLLLVLVLASCSAASQDGPNPVGRRPTLGPGAQLSKMMGRETLLQRRQRPPVLGRDNQEGFTAEGYPFKGDPEAGVVIVEFSSYQCPFCARYFERTYPTLMAEYVETGLVTYIFRRISSADPAPITAGS